MSSGGGEKKVHFLEEIDWLNLTTDCKKLINTSSLTEVFEKTGFETPPFVIKPTREKVNAFSVFLVFIHLVFRHLWFG